MIYRLEFELPGLPRMINASGHSKHWAVRHHEAKKWINAVGIAVNARGRPRAPLVRARLILTRYSSVAPDPDGLVSGFKHVIDGLVEAGVLTNDRFTTIAMPTYHWIKAPAKQGMVRVVVEEFTGDQEVT